MEGEELAQARDFDGSNYGCNLSHRPNRMPINTETLQRAQLCRVDHLLRCLRLRRASAELRERYVERPRALPGNRDDCASEFVPASQNGRSVLLTLCNKLRHRCGVLRFLELRANTGNPRTPSTRRIVIFAFVGVGL